MTRKHKKGESLVQVLTHHVRSSIRRRKCAICGAALGRLQKSFLCRGCRTKMKR